MGKRFPAEKSLVFLLIIGQSSLYLTSPRVAWEVNTFTLFFSSLLLISIAKLVSRQKMQKRWIFVVLFICMVGSYNHIIFSALPFALFFSFFFQMLFNKNTMSLKYVLLFATALIDIVLQLLIFKYLEIRYMSFVIYYPVLLLLMLFIQTQLLSKTNLLKSKSLKVKTDKRVILIVSIIVILFFIYFHGKAFFETLASYKVYMQYYSWVSGLWIIALSIICAATFAFFLFKAIYKDVFSDKPSFHTIFLLCYLAVFPFYTTSNSYRYYLELHLIVALHLAVVGLASFRIAWQRLLVCMLIISVFATLYTHLKIFNNRRQDKALYFSIGNSQTETSAHFSSKKPLIQFLKENKVDSVIILDSQAYFLKVPINFYRITQPWPVTKGKKALLMYQRTDKNKGGIIYFLAD